MIPFYEHTSYINFNDEQRRDWIEKSHSHEITEETRKKLSEALKKARAEKGSEWAKDYTPWNKGLKTGPSPFKGKKRGPLLLSEEGKQHKIDFCKATFTGKAKTKEHREKISKTLKGRKQKQETIQHMRTAKQKFFENFQYEVRTCPYCGKQGKSYAMDRWHFERCKFKEAFNARIEDGFSNEKGSTL